MATQEKYEAEARRLDEAEGDESNKVAALYISTCICVGIDRVQRVLCFLQAGCLLLTLFACLQPIIAKLRALLDNHDGIKQQLSDFKTCCQSEMERFTTAIEALKSTGVEHIDDERAKVGQPTERGDWAIWRLAWLDE